MSILPKNKFLQVLILSALLLNGCSSKPATPTATPVPPTETPPPPTPTSLPMALRVNETGILQTDYDEELKRFEAARQALGKTITPEEIKTQILDDLTGSVLLYQAAIKNGYKVSETDVDSHIAQLTQTMGGADAFNTWLQTNFYTIESFRRALTLSLGAAWERDEIIKSMPGTIEQVHARQILFTREESAINYRQQVDNGADFATLASEADPVTHGDLGWFPRGYLLQPEVEEAAFKLQPGEVSQVIKSAIGFHLVQVIEKDPARPLDPDTKTKLESLAITNWVKQARSAAKVEILVP
jgi:peptidyl-prolyl cis-trans isomerase C